MNESENMLLGLVQAQLQGQSDRAEIERIAHAAGTMIGLPPQSIQAVIARLHGDAPGSTQAAASETPHVAAAGHPRLMVDWGVEPRVGWETCPEFHLVCPPDYRGRPVVEVSVDQRLDHALPGPRPVLHAEEPGYWTFDVPFGLTTHGNNCRPGHYLVQLRVVFPDASPPAPRAFSCRIRLSVLDPAENPGRTLEIDGDGQSILNIHGSDLASFSRVVLKGGDRAILNIQEPAHFFPDARQSGAAPAKGPCKFEYQLKVDEARDRLLPRVSPAFRRPQPAEAAALILPSGQRILLLTRRAIKLGRNRVNQIVTRFLPDTPENSQRSERISREHFSLELTEEGLRATDHDSSKGTSLAHEPLHGSRLLTAEHAVKEIDLQLGLGRSSDMPLHFSLRLFAGASDHLSTEWIAGQDQAICDLLGTELPRLWHLSRASQIDACRLKRMNNLREEQYVVIFRQAIVGSSEDNPVCIAGPLINARHARIVYLDDCFWLENLADPQRCQVDGQQVPLRELVPLAFGTNLKFAGTTVCFEEFHQMHL